jgi:tRNA/tmRNA/rRNA uracil-C5-methylase (TrmA/RlmC/RlmD family)
VTDACLVAHPLLEGLIVAGRYPGAGEVLLRVGVASGERLVRVDRPDVAARVKAPAGVRVIAAGDGERGAVHEELAGRRFRISADSFFQPGPVAAEALAGAVDDSVAEALPAGGHLVDAYAGVGLFASVLGSRRGARVTAVERDPAAVADAAVNLADVEARIVSREVARWRPRRGERVDVVVADPSRTGLGRPGVEAVAVAGAPRVVLVSCDPASFARDVRLLNQAGYRLSVIRTVDAFPHTFHTETVSTFDR